MKATSEQPFEEPKNEQDSDIMTGQSANLDALSSDPDYEKLIEHYQSGEVDLCNMVLFRLKKRYPGHPELIKIEDELRMKSSVRDLTTKIKKGERRENRKITLNLGIFAVLGTIIVMIAFLFSLFYFGSQTKTEEVDQVATQVFSLEKQAEQLLTLGRPGPAADVIEKIRNVNPDYEKLPELTSRVETLFELERKYEEASQLIEEDKKAEALMLFKEIEAEQPGMWDVPQQIAAIEEVFQVADYLEEGQLAFQAENWDLVISSYESAMALDPSLDDPLMKEQLLNGYLNKIISMLQDDNDSSEEDIGLAEQYYRKAVALIPQSREYANERGNLQELSRDLLEQKYTQLGKSLLADKKQTTSSVAKAVSYFRKAVSINPTNALQSDLKNAELYQVGFKNFVDMNWTGAVNNLSQIVDAHPNFANGNARTLLYEAYYGLGKQYIAASLYQDAMRNLEQAEILAWDDGDNLLKLFQVQTLLGEVLGRMGEYQNSVSYYQYALEEIEVFTRLTNYENIANEINRAIDLALNENYEEASAVFQEVMTGIDVVYTISEEEIGTGVCIALFAQEYNSTMDAVLDANDLSNMTVITFGRTLNVPTIEK